ncbi:flagellar motor stator protein MotA [Helicobacter kayseriensis]|uniref:flagellar motor stator protein MotA n=1 Tax=Helicobacter kayseriensis TaxID=2905877 RepID=UPI001E5E4927|nr:flagellar motor stator protein MotA [Helicobacter kayseriensis]MCE3047080.1 flagellar motor stator protein MotA [Helicobacter kayseriensis]MCE3048260.1 flagellar motor stator protein MotA [Helicobacter kayseriensis]
MDLSTILGMVLAVTSISVGDILEGGNPLHVIHLSSVLIVIPTALFSAMTGTNAKFIKAGYKELKLVFASSPVDIPEKIKLLVEFSTIARRDGVLALESRVAQLDDDFMREALSMIIDGRDAHSVKEDMEIQIEQIEEYYHGAGHYWILAGESCPVFGLVGAVFGLMLALQLLDNPAKMAAGIAGAFTATVTGIMGAYAIFAPWGNKMIAKSKDIVKEKTMILEGVIGIANGDNPRNLEAKLFGFLDPSQPKISQFN